MPRSSPGGGWAQVELTDALRKREKERFAKENKALKTTVYMYSWSCSDMPDPCRCMANIVSSILRVSEKEFWAQLVSNTLRWVN